MTLRKMVFALSLLVIVSLSLPLLIPRSRAAALAPSLVGWGGPRLKDTNVFNSTNPPSVIFPGRRASNFEVEVQRMWMMGLNTVRASFAPSCYHVANDFMGLYNSTQLQDSIQIARYYSFWVVVDYHGYNEMNTTQSASCWLSSWKPIVQGFMNSYSQIIWEPLNEPAGLNGNRTTLNYWYQQWINQARSLGDTHWIVVQNLCSFGCGLPLSSFWMDYPIVTDPLGWVFISLHPYMDFQTYQATWSNATAETVARQYYLNMLNGTLSTGWPVLNTEGGAAGFSFLGRHGVVSAPDTVLSGSAGYSKVTFHFIQTLTNYLDNNQPQRIGWLWWPAGGWANLVAGTNEALVLGAIDPRDWGGFLQFKKEDFTISASRTSLNIPKGTPGVSIISLTSLGGFAGTVSLTAKAFPSGPTVSLSLTSLLLVSGGANSSGLSIDSTSAPPGTYVVNVTGTTGPVTSPLTHFVTITVHIEDFTISAPTSMSFNTGAPSSIGLTLTSISNFAGTVALTATVAPAGLTAVCSSAPLTANSTASASCSLSSTTAGTYAVTITGTNTSSTATLTHSVTVTVHVGDFNITATGPVNFNGGAAASVSITLTSVQNFAGTVALNSTVTPSGLTVTCPSTPVGLTANGTNPASCSLSSTVAGVYGVTITGGGSQGTASHSASVTVHVGDFTISAIPSSVSFNSGAPAPSINVTLTSVQNFAGGVALTSTVTSSGLTVTCPSTPVGLTANSTAVTSCSLTSSTPAVYFVTVTGRASPGTASHQAVITAHVGDFSISVNGPVSFNSGASVASISVSMNSAFDFAGGVSLSSVVSPVAGLNVSCPATPVSLTAGGTATGSCSLSSTTAGTYTVTIIGSGSPGTASHQATTTVRVGDFTISASSPVSFNSGLSVAISASLVSRFSFAGNVSITVAVSPPAGMTVTCPVTPVSLGPNQIVGVSCSLSSSTPGTYAVIITGSGLPGTASHQASIIVHVGSFTISAPASVSFNTGASGGSISVVLTSTFNFAGTVALSSTVSSPGVTVTCPATPVSLTANNTSPGSCSLSSTTPGVYSVTITGSGSPGTAAQSAAVTVHVGDFQISASGSVSFNSGAPAPSINVTLTSVQNFAGTVALSSTVTPSGLTVTCPSTSVPLTANITTSASCSLSSTTAGVYGVTITGGGSQGTASHSATVTVHVGDFTVSAGSPVSFNSGAMGASITLVLTSVQNFAGSVALTSTVTPSGLTVTCPTTPVGLTTNGTANPFCSLGSATPGVYRVTITGSGSPGTASHQAVVAVHVGDFTISAIPSSVSFNSGAPAPSINVTLTSVQNFAGSVILTSSVNPATGLTVTCPSAPVGLTVNTTALASCSVTSSTSAVYVVTMTGRASLGTASHQAVVTVHVGDFTVSAGSPVSFNSGAMGASITLVLTSVQNFAGSVALTSTVTSSGLTVTCPSTPVGLTTNGTANPFCSLGSATPGVYRVTITGSGSPGTASQSAAVTVHVGDFQISAPGSVSFNSGAAAPSINVTLTGVNNFAGTVVLTVTVSPPTGLLIACSFPSTGISLTTNGTAKEFCSLSSTALGTYSVTVTSSGSPGTASHSLAVTVHVGEFTIKAMASVSFNTGAPAVSTFNLTSINNFAGSVTLGTAVIPPLGLTVGCPASVVLTANGTASVTCNLGSSTPATYTVSISAFTSSLSVISAVTVHVGDFQVSASSPAAANVGQSATSNFTLTSVNNFNGTITLTDNVPNHLSCFALSPTRVTFKGNGTAVATLTCTSRSAQTFTVAIAALGSPGTATHSAAATFAFTEFTIAATSPPPVNVGQQAATTITVTGSNGFAGTVVLSDTPLPVGLTCGLITPSSFILPSPPATATLSCNSLTQPAGNFTVTITGTSSSLVEFTTVKFTFTDFSIAAGAVTPGAIIAGSSGASTITVTAVNSFTGTVALSVSPSVNLGLACTLPSGLTLPPSPATATLSCTSPSAGDFTVTLKGTSGSLSHNATLIVFHFVDFNITATSPASVNARSPANSTIIIASVNGLSGAVVLTDTVPNGLTCTNLGSIILPPSPGTATLSCRSASAGNFIVTITGTIGSRSLPTSATFTFADFAINATSPASMNAGSTSVSSIAVSFLNGFTGTVALSESGPTGLTCGPIIPTSVTLPPSPAIASLTCTAPVNGTFTVSISGTIGQLIHSANATFTFADFAISASPASITTTLGTPGISTIALTSLFGFAGTVRLSAVSPILGPTVSLSLTNVTLSSGGMVQLGVAVADNRSESFTVTVTGISGSLSHSVIIPVTVTDFSLAATPPAVVNVGQPTTSMITVTGLNGFSGSVSLSVTPFPTGLACTISPNGVTGSGTAMLSCSSASRISFNVTITGMSGPLVHSTSATFTFADFSILVSAVTPSAINPGSSGISTITVKGLNGFTGTVAFTVSPSNPAGLTCSSPASVALPSSPGTSTLSCSATVAGDYTVTLTGTSGSLSHNTGLILFHAVDFFITATSPASVPAGTSAFSPIAVTALNGFTGTVILSVSSSTPAGLTCSPLASVALPPSPANASLSCRATVAGNYNVTVTGTATTSGSPVSHTTATITFHVVDFIISATPVSLIVNVGASNTSTITLTSLAGFAGSVTLNVSASGLTAFLSPSPVLISPAGSGFSTLTVSSSSIGTFTAVVTGTSGSLAHAATVRVSVVDFSISATPATLIIAAGSSTASTITLTSLGGFAGSVSLSGAAPSGLGATLNPTTVILIGGKTASADLTVTPNSNMAAANYNVTVTGVTGFLSRFIKVVVTVTGFKISASIPLLTFPAGSSGSSNITVTSLNGFSGSVALTAIQPAGLFLSLSQPSVTLSAGTSAMSTLTVFAPSSTAGAFRVNVTGSSGSQSHTFTLTISVASLVISVSPVSLTIPDGLSNTSSITLTSVNGFNGTVTLSASTPLGLTSFLNPASLILSSGGSATSTLTVTVTATAPANYTVTVTGTSGSLSRSATIPVHAVDFKVSTSPSSLTIPAGSSDTSLIIVASLNGFVGRVGLTATVSSGTSTPLLSPANLTLTSGGSFDSTLTLSTANMVPGSYTVTVMATSGSLIHTVLVAVKVVDFTISSPGQVSFNTGVTNVSVTVRLTSSNNFAGNVSLSSTVTPSGLTVTCPSSPVSLPANTTSLVSCLLGSTTPGIYAVTITGAGAPGTASHSASATVHVGDFAISVTSPVSFNSGGSASTTVILASTFNFVGSVALRTMVSPSTGLTVTCPSSVALTSNATVAPICSLDSSTTGTYAVTIAGSGSPGTSAHSAGVTVHVGDFTISAGSPVSFNNGATSSLSITLTSVQNFAAGVALTSTVTPSGLTVTCPSSPVSLPANATSTVSCLLGSTTPGTYSVTITGAGAPGTASHSASATVHVGDFAISLTGADLNVGQAGVLVGITLTSTFNFAGTLTLTGAATPSGLTVTCPATVVTLTANATKVAACSLSSTAAGTYAVIVGASGSPGTSSHSAGATVHVGDFTIIVTGTNLNIGQTGASVWVILTSTFNSAGTVALTGTSTPSGLTVTCPGSLPLSANATLSLSCSLSSSTPGTYAVTIAGSGSPGTASHSASVTIHVGDFQVVAPSGVSFNVGASGASAGFVLTSVNNFAGSVSLTMTVSPTGLTVTCSSTPLTLTLTANATTPGSCSLTSTTPGTYAVAITGSASPGTAAHTVGVIVHVGDLQVSAPGQVSFNTGATNVSVMAILTSVNNFAGSVSLGSTVTPTNGLTVTCPTTPASLSANATVTASCAVFSTTPGTYSVTTIGSGSPGITVHSAPTVVHVGDFAISASPGSVSFNAGASAPSVPVTLTSVNNFAGSVTLTAAVTPTTALTVSCSAAVSLMVNATANASCSLSSTTPGTYKVMITGVGSQGSASHSASATVHVGGFTISSQVSVSFNTGASGGSISVVLTSTFNFAGTVALTSMVSPATGLTVTCPTTPVGLTANGTAPASCMLNSTTLGVYTVTITGSSSPGTITQSTGVTVHVGDFQISAPASVSFNTGPMGASISITLTGVNNFAGSVTLTPTISPATGLTVTCPTTPVNLSANSTAPVSCSFSSATAGVYGVTITGVGSPGSASHSGGMTVHVGEFAISAGSPLSFNGGATGSVSVTLTSVQNFAGTVALSSTVAPSGLIVTCPATPVSLTANSTAPASCSLSSTTLGTYAVTISGIGLLGTASHSAIVTVHVGDFTITASGPVSFNSGAVASVSITLTSVQNFAGTVALSSTVAPSGLTVACPSAPVPLTVNGTAPASCSLSSAIPGTYAITITGSGLPGTASHQASIIVHVGGFTISASASVSFNAGALGGSIPVVLTSTFNFAGTVALSSTVSSPGVTVACPATPVGLTANNTSPGSCSLSSTTPGVYSVTITGSGSPGVAAQSAAVTVHVGDFSITATGAVNFNSGAAAPVSVTLTSVQNFAGTVALSSTVASSGLIVTCPATPVSLTANSTAPASCSLSSTTLGTYAVTISGIGLLGTASHSAIVTVHVGDFTITASGPVSFNSGATSSIAVTLTSVQNFTGTVTLTSSVSSVSGLTVICPSTPVILTAIASSNAFCSLNSTTPGTYTVTITGSGLPGTSVHPANLSVHVGDFQISAPGQVSFNMGTTSIDVTVSLTSLNSFAGTVSFGSVGPTTGLTVACPSTFVTLTLNVTTNLSCSLNSVTPGTYSVTITSSGFPGTAVHVATVNIHVGGFQISALGEVSLNSGATGASLTITLTSVDNFAGTVSLGPITRPSTGLAVTCPLASVTLMANGTTTAACGLGSTNSGTYAVTITGIGSPGTASDSATISVHVGDFRIATPGEASFNTGATGMSVTVTLTSIDNFAGTVGLNSAVSLVPGLTVTCPSTPAALVANATATVNCGLSSSTPGTFAVTIIGSGSPGTSVQSANLTVHVGDFQVVAPSEVSFNAGASGTSVGFVLASVNNFAGSVSLTMTVSPTGLTVTCSSPLTLTANATTPGSCSLTSTTSGTYAVVITGSASPGTAAHTVDVIVHVGDLQISVPGHVSFNTGATNVSVTVALSSANNFAGSVSLSSTVTPTNGLAATCPSTPVVLTANATANASCSLSSSVPGSYAVMITGSGSPGTSVRSANLIVHVGDFQISAAGPVDFNSGGTGSATATLTSINNFAGIVTLTAMVGPATGLTVTCPSAHVSLAANVTANASCSLSSTTPGAYAVTVSGASSPGTASHQASVTVHIGDFAVSAGTPVSLNSGAVASVLVTLSSVQNFAGIVALSSTVASSGLTVACPSAPVPLTVNGTAPAFCSLSSAIPGTYAITITGSGLPGTASHQASIIVHVGGFTISASASVSFNTGASGGSIPVVLTSTFNFAGTVALSSTVSSPGVTVACPGTLVGLTANNTSPGSCSLSSTTPGVYSVTITGSGSPGAAVQSAAVTVHVGDFSITATGAVNFNSGAAAPVSVTLTSVQNFAGIVALSSTVASSGLIVTCPATPVSLTANSTAPASCSLSSTTLGTYAVTISGSGLLGTASHSAIVTVHVGDFTITASGPVSFNSGATSSIAVTLTSVQNFAGTVTLAATVGSASLIVSCPSAPVNLTANVTALSSCSLSSETPGTYEAIIIGAASMGAASHSKAVTVHVGDFQISALSASVGLVAGSLGSSIFTLNSTAFSGTVSLSATVSPIAPGGPTVSFSPGTVFLSAGGSGTSVLTVTTIPSTNPTNYTITVTGTSGSLVHPIRIFVTVSSFTISASPTLVMDQPGSSNSSAAILTSVNGFAGNVSLSVLVAPLGPGVSLDRSSITLTSRGSVTSTLTFFTNASLSPGDYSITVTGASGPLSLSTTVTLRVTDFAMYASPTSITFLAGLSNASIISLQSLNGFNSSVVLGEEVSPLLANGPAATLNPPIVILSSRVPSASSLKVSTTPFSPSGIYTVTVTGTSGSTTHSVIVRVTVTSDFTPSASSPTPSSFVAGGSTMSTIDLTSTGFTGTLLLTGVVSPVVSNGPALSLGASSVTLMPGGSISSILMVSTIASTPNGTYTVTVNAKSGLLSHSISFVFQVAGDFTVSARPNSLVIDAGSSGVSTITLSSYGLLGSFSLSTSVPSGLLGSLSTTAFSLSPGGSSTSTLTVVTAASTPAGIYTIIITSTSSPAMTHVSSVTVTVTPDFAISASPASPASFVDGGSATSTVTLNSLGLTGNVTLSASVSPSVTNGPTTMSGSPSVSLTPGSLGTSSATVSTAASTPADVYTITVTGTTGSLAHSTSFSITVTADFTITSSPPSPVSFVAGSSATSTISLGSKGLAGSVSLSALVPFSATGAGALFSLNSVSLTPGASGTSVMTINTNASSPAGSYTIAVTGTSGSLTHTTMVTITVTADFTISASSPAEFVAGGSATSTVTLGSLGFAGAVTLSASTAAPVTGLSLTFSLNPVSLTAGGSGVSRLAVAATYSTLAGTYTLTVTGAGGVLTRSAALTITVTSDFNIAASQTSTVVPVGSLSISTITLNSTGFSGSVRLYGGVLPVVLNGPTVSFHPATVSLSAGGSGNSSLTVSTASSVSPGTYQITVVGSSGELNHSLTFAVTVIPLPVLRAPGPLTVEAGSSLTFMVNATDPDPARTVSLNASGLPLGANFPQAVGTGIVSGVFSWTPSAAQAPFDYTVTFTARDDRGAMSRTQVVIHVATVEKVVGLPFWAQNWFLPVVGVWIGAAGALLLRRVRRHRKGQQELPNRLPSTTKSSSRSSSPSTSRFCYLSPRLFLV